jgi:hypothetical protein
MCFFAFKGPACRKLSSPLFPFNLNPQTSSLSPLFFSDFRIPNSDFDIASLPPTFPPSQLRFLPASLLPSFPLPPSAFSIPTSSFRIPTSIPPPSFPASWCHCNQKTTSKNYHRPGQPHGGVLFFKPETSH